MFVILLNPSLRCLIAQAQNWEFNKIRGGTVLWEQCFSHQRALWGIQSTYLNLGCEWWPCFAFHDCCFASLTWKIKLSHYFPKVTEKNLFPAKRNFNKDFFSKCAHSRKFMVRNFWTVTNKHFNEDSYLSWTLILCCASFLYCIWYRRENWYTESLNAIIANHIYSCRK